MLTDSITPDSAGQVWLTSPDRYPFLNTVVRVSDYDDVENASRTTAFPISNRSLPTGQADLHGGRDHPLLIITETDAEDAHLDLMLRHTEALYIQRPNATPAGREGNLLLPGSMWVLVGTIRKHRIGGVSPYNLHILPLVETNPPGPDVVGGTLTWGSVLNLYGSWEAVASAHATWADLLEVIGSPDDLVTV